MLATRKRATILLSPSVIFRFQMSSTCTMSEVLHGPAGVQGRSHLISECQKIVIGQNCGRCMVVMLRTRVKHDWSSPTTHRQYLESKPIPTVIKDTNQTEERKGRTDPCPSELSGQPRRGPSWREREREDGGHTEPEFEADKGKSYVGDNHKLTSFSRWFPDFLSSLKASVLDPRLSATITTCF